MRPLPVPKGRWHYFQTEYNSIELEYWSLLGTCSVQTDAKLLSSDTVVHVGNENSTLQAQFYPVSPLSTFTICIFTPHESDE